MARRNTSANRYAEAVFQVARDGQSFDLWLTELGELVQLLGDPLAAQVLQNPAIPIDRKAAILTAALPGQSEPIHRFVDLLLRRNELPLVGQIVERLTELIDEYRGIETVTVTTAIPLDQGERDLLTQRLSRQTGKQVRLQESVDPALIGGVVAQIGDEIIDGSVRGRLERLRRVLSGS